MPPAISSEPTISSIIKTESQIRTELGKDLSSFQDERVTVMYDEVDAAIKDRDVTSMFMSAFRAIYDIRDKIHKEVNRRFRHNNNQRQIDQNNIAKSKLLKGFEHTTLLLIDDVNNSIRDGNLGQDNFLSLEMVNDMLINFNNDRQRREKAIEDQEYSKLDSDLAGFEARLVKIKAAIKIALENYAAEPDKARALKQYSDAIASIGLKYFATKCAERIYDVYTRKLRLGGRDRRSSDIKKATLQSRAFAIYREIQLLIVSSPQRLQTIAGDSTLLLESTDNHTYSASEAIEFAGIAEERLRKITSFFEARDIGEVFSDEPDRDKKRLKLKTLSDENFLDDIYYGIDKYIAGLYRRLWADKAYAKYVFTPKPVNSISTDGEPMVLGVPYNTFKDTDLFNNEKLGAAIVENTDDYNHGKYLAESRLAAVADIIEKAKAGTATQFEYAYYKALDFGDNEFTATLLALHKLKLIQGHLKKSCEDTDIIRALRQKKAEKVLDDRMAASAKST